MVCEQCKGLLGQFRFRLRQDISGAHAEKFQVHLYHKAYVICWKTISENAFSKKADDLQVDENLERFREICPGQTKELRLLQISSCSSTQFCRITYPKLLFGCVCHVEFFPLFRNLLF
jgi:hypothetical protein